VAPVPREETQQCGDLRLFKIVCGRRWRAFHRNRGDLLAGDSDTLIWPISML